MLTLRISWSGHLLQALRVASAVALWAALVPARAAYVTDRVELPLFENPSAEATVSSYVAAGMPVRELERNGPFARVRTDSGQVFQIDRLRGALTRRWQIRRFVFQHPLDTLPVVTTGSQTFQHLAALGTVVQMPSQPFFLLLRQHVLNGSPYEFSITLFRYRRHSFVLADTL